MMVDDSRFDVACGLRGAVVWKHQYALDSGRRVSRHKGCEMQSELPIVIVETDLDELGHVNNARYFDYLERGRMDWYAQAQLFETIEQLHGSPQFGTVVVNINIDFRQECLLGETINIHTTPNRLGTKSLALRQIMVKPGGEIAADALVTSVVMDLCSRTSIALPVTLQAIFAAAAIA